jgi:hypothetical protein
MIDNPLIFSDFRELVRIGVLVVMYRFSTIPILLGFRYTLHSGVELLIIHARSYVVQL